MDLTTATIPTIHQAYKTKQLSVSEAVDFYLRRISDLDPQINSFLSITHDHAKAAALSQDQLLATNPNILSEQSLFGIPIALKDLYLTKGIRTTASSKVLDNYIPQYSGTSWVKLEKAGAILLGKLNCDAWAHGSSGENSQYGPTHNPWNLDHVPGGSSSGSGAALAANFAPITTGTDTGGSIRLPASFCGVTGLKPTYGRVSRYGIVSMASSLDTVGHFARTAEDAARVLSITAGQDQYDATTLHAEVPSYHSYLDTLPKKLTIGLPKEFFIDGIDPEVASSIQSAINDLKKHYAIEFKDVSLPHTSSGIAVYYIVQTSEVSSNLAKYTGIRYGNSRSAFGDEAKRRIMLGTYTLSAGYYDAYYKKAMQVRTLILQDYQKVFQDVDLLLTPVSPTPAFKLGAKVDDPLQMYLADVFTINVNLAGIPGLALPSGFTTTGLPIGFQLLGPHLSEQLLFQVGHSYQKVTDHHLQVPKLSKSSKD